MINESNIVIFKNLNVNVNANILNTLLKECGKINKITVIAPNGASSHIGVVVFDHISVAYEAIKKFNDYQFHSRKLTVEFCPQPLIDKLKLSEFLVKNSDLKDCTKQKRIYNNATSVDEINFDNCDSDLPKKLNRLDETQELLDDMKIKKVVQEEKGVTASVEARDVSTQKDFTDLHEFLNYLGDLRSEFGSLKQKFDSIEKGLSNLIEKVEMHF